MKAKAKSFDTIAVQHSLDPYLSTLKTNGKMCPVGISEKALSVLSVQLVAGRKMVAGSLIDGMKKTEEMLEFCGKNNIMCWVETLPVAECNTAMERLDKNDVKYRFRARPGQRSAMIHSSHYSNRADEAQFREPRQVLQRCNIVRFTTTRPEYQTGITEVSYQYHTGINRKMDTVNCPGVFVFVPEG